MRINNQIMVIYVWIIYTSKMNNFIVVWDSFTNSQNKIYIYINMLVIWCKFNLYIFEFSRNLFKIKLLLMKFLGDKNF